MRGRSFRGFSLFGRKAKRDPDSKSTRNVTARTMHARRPKGTQEEEKDREHVSAADLEKWLREQAKLQKAAAKHGVLGGA